MISSSATPAASLHESGNMDPSHSYTKMPSPTYSNGDGISCPGTLQTFVPITRLDNFYCLIIYLIISKAPELFRKYKRAFLALMKKKDIVPNVIIALELVIIALWFTLFLGDSLNAACHTSKASYASSFGISYMLMHSFYTSQLGLYNARLFSTARSLGSLSVPSQFSYIESALIFYSIVSPIIYVGVALGNIGDLHSTWGNYNRQFIVEVVLIILVLALSVSTSYKMVSTYRNVGIMMVEPILAMVFDTLESELKVYSPPMSIWKLMELLPIFSTIASTSRMDMALNASCGASRLSSATVTARPIRSARAMSGAAACQAQSSIAVSNLAS